MAKPPESTPHSDIDGVHADDRPNADVAQDLGEGAGDLKRAEDQSVARPEHSDDRSRDDRSR